ncbi:unnamed protein product, partial [Notodromas monacha]
DRKVPWKAILTSPPVLSATVVATFNGWTFVVLLSMLPTYMKVMLGYSIQANALLTSLPHLGRALFSLVYSYAADHVLKRKWFSASFVRKFSTAVMSLSRGIGLFVISFLGCDAETTVIIFVISGILNGAASSAIGPCLMEMSPNFIGTTYGIFNTGFAVSAIVAPVISASIIKGNQTFDTWATVFQIAAAFSLTSCLGFMIYGSAEEQPWNRYGETSAKIQPSTGNEIEESKANSNLDSVQIPEAFEFNTKTSVASRNSNQTFDTWATVFQIAAAFSLTSCLGFMIYGSAEEQPWNRYGETSAEIQPSTGNEIEESKSLWTDKLFHAIAVLDGLPLDIRSSESETKEAQHGSQDNRNAQMNVIDHENQHKEVSDECLDSIQSSAQNMPGYSRRPVRITNHSKAMDMANTQNHEATNDPTFSVCQNSNKITSLVPKWKNIYAMRF